MYILGVSKNLKNYIIFFKLLFSLKKLNMVCWVLYNLNVANICTYNFN